jgi:hypothetical protein
VAGQIKGGFLLTRISPYYPKSERDPGWTKCVGQRLGTNVPIASGPKFLHPDLRVWSIPQVTHYQ